MNRQEKMEFVVQELDKILLNHPEGRDALNFLGEFNNVANLIDDIIDKDEYRNNPEQLLKFAGLVMNLYTCRFYQKHSYELYGILSVIHDQYCNSVRLEKSNIQWQKEHADHLRICGNYVAVHIVRMLVGYEASRVFSVNILEDAWNRHHTELGLPV